ncbi:MAG: hypothetical protein J0H66_13495 [Solirubrobacterales bacterium]|nr:hypothetical protein [Solirubrobacterales bacterium]OJU93485.1 MAG: hypothetical protein BGO23_12595 [Solirubrobacterales bacterium 67-14]
MSQPLLIFLNEVAGGRLLLEAAREKAADASYVVVVAPQNQPSVGQLFDPEERAEAARARVDVTLAVLDEFGIEAIGEVLDPEYDLALGDAIRSHRPSEVLLSCTYDFRFGLTRRDLLSWAELTYGDVTKITHIPVRIEDDSVSLNVTHTLVVANRTLTSEDLQERLLDRSGDRPHRYTIIAPAADDVSEATVARNLASVLAKLYHADIDATGQPMSPDPFDAVKNAIEHYRVDEILISTLSGEESHWLKQDLVGRVREITDKAVIHHEAGRPPEAVAAVVAEGESPAAEAEDSTAEEKSEA